MTAILPVPQSLVSRPEAVFSPVAGQSPLMRIVTALASVADVVVAAAAPLADEVRKTLSPLHLSGAQVCIADDPGSWAECVATALRVLGGSGPVLLHDIAWPLVSPTTLERVMVALNDGATAVLPVCPVTDSIKAVDAKGAVTATVERSPLRTVQYPRGFAADELSGLVARAGSAELDTVLRSGIPVTSIEGDTDTVSVQLPRDASYLAAVIESRTDGPGR